jgi:hypothetical protein
VALSSFEARNKHQIIHTHLIEYKHIISLISNIASMAPPSSDLRKIGLEGFALIDKFYGPPRRSNMEDLASTKDATAYFVEISHVSYPKGKLPQNRWGRPIKF